jgi:hypothetical protein
MKRAFRMVLLAGVLGITAWLGADQPANAVANCYLIDGTYCDADGDTTFCSWVGTPFTSNCECLGHVWYC